MTPKELFNRLTEYPQPTRTEVLEALEMLTRNYNQEYTTALLSDFEDLLNDWKYNKVVARLKTEFNEAEVKLNDEHCRFIARLKAEHDDKLEAYYIDLHHAQNAIAMGSSDTIEWPEEPAPFIAPCRMPSVPFTPPPPENVCYDDSSIHVPYMYEYSVKVLRSKNGIDTSTTGTAPEGWRLPIELDTPECWEIWRQAIEKKLITDNFIWQKGLQLLACFAREMSLRFSLGKGVNSDGKKRINWKIFEELFNIEKGKLRSNYNDIQKTGIEPSEIMIINEIFGV